ncbi:MAG: phosphoglycerate dehydrogenase [Clostridiales bacterium]|nr:phosphoglycerate dehydrogenase [Clostridiales bacterium]
MKRVLVTSRSFGTINDRVFRILDEAGIDYTLMGVDFDYASFAVAVTAYDALIIGAHPFEPEDLERCDKLRIICKHGAGVDNIPLEKAKEMGITVTNAPATNAEAVADLTFAHILNSSRGLSLSNARIHAGQYQTYIGSDVWGKTLGLVGFGAIARAVARRAAGFSMKVLVFDPYVNHVPEEMDNYVNLLDFDSLLAESDIVSIHAPLTEETRYLFNSKTILRMRKDALLVNMARGGIVQEEDLYACMKSGHLSGAALDVTEDEPVRDDNPLLQLENVVITAHMGMYTAEALNAIGITCAENVVRKLRGEAVLYEVG